MDGKSYSCTLVQTDIHTCQSQTHIRSNLSPLHFLSVSHTHTFQSQKHYPTHKHTHLCSPYTYSLSFTHTHTPLPVPKVTTHHTHTHTHTQACARVSSPHHTRRPLSLSHSALHSAAFMSYPPVPVASLYPLHPVPFPTVHLAFLIPLPTSSFLPFPQYLPSTTPL